METAAISGTKRKIEGEYYIINADKLPSKGELKEAIASINRNIEILSKFERHRDEVLRLRAVVPFLELLLHKMS